MSREIVLFSFTNFQPPWSVVDPWEGSRGTSPPAPLFLDQTEAQRDYKIVSEIPPPPAFFLRVWMTRLPLIWRSGSANVDLYLGCCWASTPTAHEGCMSLTADCRMVWSSFLGPWSLLLIQWWHSRNTWLDLTP